MMPQLYSASWYYERPDILESPGAFHTPKFLTASSFSEDNAVEVVFAVLQPEIEVRVQETPAPR
jgi:hypothetical protein